MIILQSLWPHSRSALASAEWHIHHLKVCLDRSSSSSPVGWEEPGSTLGPIWQWASFFLAACATSKPPYMRLAPALLARKGPSLQRRGAGGDQRHLTSGEGSGQVTWSNHVLLPRNGLARRRDTPGHRATRHRR